MEASSALTVILFTTKPAVITDANAIADIK